MVSLPGCLFPKWTLKTINFKKMAIVPIPIFIYKDRKSDEEIRKEMERDARMRKAIEEDERRERERKNRAEREKKLKAREEHERKEREYREAREKNPWDFQFMPEGWSILGQTYITPIDEF